MTSARRTEAANRVVVQGQSRLVEHTKRAPGKKPARGASTGVVAEGGLTIRVITNPGVKPSA